MKPTTEINTTIDYRKIGVHLKEQRVHLAAAGAEVFQFLLSWELNLFLIGFLVTHMFPFFSVRSFRARFFYRRVRKKPIAPCAGASLYLSMV